MKTKQNNIKLGAIVLATVTALVVGLYLIGDKKNLFGDTFLVAARFNDVNGLVSGNNVRFGGVDVGTVESVEIISDTSVLVIMRVDEKYHRHIYPTSVAMLSSDGVMGNKLVAISSMNPAGKPVAANSMIKSVNPVSMDETTRTLSITNNNLKEITDNVKSMTDKLDSSALWMVLSDTSIAESLRNSTYSLNESLNAFSNSFLVRALSRDKKDKKEQKEK